MIFEGNFQDKFERVKELAAGCRATVFSGWCGPDPPSWPGFDVVPQPSKEYVAPEDTELLVTYNCDPTKWLKAFVRDSKVPVILVYHNEMDARLAAGLSARARP